MRTSIGMAVAAGLTASLAISGCGSTTSRGAVGLAASDAPLAATAPAAGQPAAADNAVPSAPAPAATSSPSVSDSAAPSASASSSPSATPTASPTTTPTASATPTEPACPLVARATCDGADLAGADLSGRQLQSISLRGADLSRANLTGTDLTGANLSGANLTGAKVGKVILDSADLSTAVLVGLDLGTARLVEANLTGTNLTKATLTGADLTAATVKNTVLEGAVLAGATLARTDLRALPLAGRDLSRASLAGTNLAQVNLTGTNLTDAVLTGADLTRSTLTDAVLTRATLAKANLTDASATTTAFSDPALASAKMCRTKVAGGVIDSRSCPCTEPGGGAYSGDYPLLGTIALGAYRWTPRGYLPAQGQLVSVNQNQAMASLLGPAWGGAWPRTMAMPKITGPWAGIRTGTEGTGQCLQWSVATNGLFPIGNSPKAYPGEVYFSSVIAGFLREHMLAAGATVSDVGRLLGDNFTAYQIPASWEIDGTETMLGEIRLFNTDFPLPAPFVPADGRATSDQRIVALLGQPRLPQVVAPSGYVWAVATEGIWPSQG